MNRTDKKLTQVDPYPTLRQVRRRLILLLIVVITLSLFLVMITIPVILTISSGFASIYDVSFTLITLICAINVTLLGIFFSLIQVKQVRQQYQNVLMLDSVGEIAQGMIIDCWEDRSGEMSEFFVICQFRNDFEIKAKINLKIFERLNTGDLVKIRYLPENPHISRPEWA